MQWASQPSWIFTKGRVRSWIDAIGFIGSPHVAGLSLEGQIDNRTKQAQEVVRVLTGEPPRNPVFVDE